MALSRDQIIEIMPASLVNKLSHIEAMFDEQRKSTIRWHHELGKVLKSIQDSPDRYRGTSGEDPIDLLADALDKHRSTLQLALRFYSEYPTADELKTILEAAGSTSEDGAVTWSHIPILLIVKKGSRKKWIARVVKDGLSAAALHAEIREAQGAAGDHGRPYNVPTTPYNQLRQMCGQLRKVQRQHDQLWNGDNSVFDNLAALDDEHVDESVLSRVEEAVDVIDDVISKLTVIKRQAEEQKVRATSVLKDREDAAAKEQAAAASQVASSTRRSRVLDTRETDDTSEAPAARRPRRQAEEA